MECGGSPALSDVEGPPLSKRGSSPALQSSLLQGHGFVHASKPLPSAGDPQSIAAEPAVTLYERA